MGISKRLKASGYKGPHPLADWRSDSERLGPPLDKLLSSPPALRAWQQSDPDAPPGVVRRPHGFYSFDGAWSRYGEGPFPDVLPPPGNVGERCKLTLATTPLHIMAPVDLDDFIGSLPKEAQEAVEKRTAELIPAIQAGMLQGWLESVVEAGRPDVGDPEAWMPPEPSEIARDVPPQYEPLPGQSSFLDALEAKPAAGTPYLWGVKAKRREKRLGQTFLFLEA